MDLKDKIKNYLRRNGAIIGLIAYPVLVIGTMLSIEALTTKKEAYADKETVLLVERKYGCIEMIPFRWKIDDDGTKHRWGYLPNHRYIDKNSDGILDKHYYYMPTSPHCMAAMVTEKKVTEEDQRRYKQSLIDVGWTNLQKSANKK